MYQSRVGQAYDRGARSATGRCHCGEADAETGWTLEKIKGAYEKSYDYYGTPMNEGVKEIVWKGGSLADEDYDEFVFRALLTDSLPVGKTLYLSVVQECPDGAAERRIETPAEGQSSDDLEYPAPGINLLEKTGTH